MWLGDNFAGTELNRGVEYARIAEACDLKGVQVRTTEALSEALAKAIEEQMGGEKVTTFIEVVLNQELGEPFRRDAMKKPVRVAGIDRADMQAQVGAA